VRFQHFYTKFDAVELEKNVEPHGTALGSTPEVSGNERFRVTDVSYDVKRAKPKRNSESL
jgi:hypothetical protein